MKRIFKKKWLWITALFLIINILGLTKIVSILEHERSMSSLIKKSISQVLYPIRQSVATKFTKKQEEFTIEYVSPKMNEESPRIYIRFSENVDLEKAKGYIDIKPEISFHIEKSYSGISIYADFVPGTTYAIELLKSMPSSKEGLILKESLIKEVIAPDYDKDVRFKVPGMYMSSQGSKIIPVDVMNLDKIGVEIHRVYENNIVYLLNNMSSYSIPTDMGIDLFEKEIETEAERNIAKDVLIDLKEILPENSHGLFFMRVKEPDSYYRNTETKLVLTTDIGIIAKKSGSGLLVWLNSLATANPIPFTKVRVYTKTNQQILEGTTDEEGIIHFKDISWEGDRSPYVITASNKDDLSFIELDKCDISETAFDIQGRPYLSSGYEAFIYTDRGVYRPGETVRVKAILRGIGYSVPESFPINIEVKRPDETEYEMLNGMLSQFGTIETAIDIERSSLTGVYTINLLLPGNDKPIGTCKFNVEEFMPGRLKVNIDVADKRFSIQDEVPVTVKAEQSFGGPAQGRDVELSCDIRLAEFKPKGFSDYIFTDQEKTFTTQTLRFGEKKTDSEGKSEFTISFPQGVLPPSAIECSIQLTAKELGGRAVTTHATRSIDPYPYYIGIKRIADGYASVGEPMKFDYVVVSPEGKELTPTNLKVEVSKIEYNSVLKKNDRGEYRYTSEKYEELIFEDLISQTGSSGSYEYTPKSYGNYMLRIRSSEKESHVSGVKFYCSGYGYAPWAMEKPDKIELTLDKTLYDVGDTATLLIKSPFKGEALITVSKDTVLFTKRVTLTSMTQEVPIKITDDFSPNAYCSITVIKPLESSQQWVSHRAYGIIPIMLDNSFNKLDVSIKTKDEIEPRDDLAIEIEVRDADGQPKEAELSVVLVDEGILQLTNFKTPDPYEFFYGKKSNSIYSYDLYSLLLPEYEQERVGSDSTPSADLKKELSFDPKKHLNPISAKRVKPAVLWQGTVLTDIDGKARHEFRIPEFIGSLRIMVVAVGADEFGNNQKDVKVTEPLIITPTLPRFLSMNDRAMVNISVFNNTGEDGTASISAYQVQKNRSDVTGPEWVLNVGNNSEEAIDVPIVHSGKPGKIEIKIRAELNDYKSERTIELPIRPPVPYTAISGSGRITAPADVPVAIPGNWLKGTEGYSLVVMPLPGLQFAGALKYLARYPYGCIEQTTSCVYPLLYLKDIASAVDSDKYSPQVLNGYIDTGIRKILSMQTYSGGFAMWPGYQKPYNWGSIYATDFLVEADRAGYTINKRSKKRALQYLEKLLSDDDVSLNLKAYCCFVLSKAGKIKHSWVRRLQEKSQELSASSKFYLASSLSFLGDSKAASLILGEGLPDEDIKRETGEGLRSYVKENSIALSTYMDLDPENSMVPILVKRLELSMINGDWGTTQDNAQALLALGKYARYIEDNQDNYTGEIIIGKETVAQFDNEQKADLKGLDLGEKDIVISVKGEGNVYYYWSAEGVPLKEKVEEKDRGIRIRRSFYKRDGSEVTLDRIEHGEVIVVDIAIDADMAYQNVLVEDLLPACFEIENPRLVSSEKLNWIGEDSFEPDHIDIRDDRLLLFTDLPDTKNLHYRYIVRAVTKGKFILPAISASCMYDPSIISVSGQGSVEVKDKNKLIKGIKPE